MTKISILAVLADRDLELDLSRKNRTKHFNPRGPCGPRQRAFGGRRPQVIFQSSRSLRTATRASSGRNGDHQYFNPRGPCGPQLLNLRPKEVPPNISILAVLADRDMRSPSGLMRLSYFNPRGPCGPRLQLSPDWRGYHLYFNPRGPCGPRRGRSGHGSAASYFNPRGPCGPRPSSRLLGGEK